MTDTWLAFIQLVSAALTLGSAAMGAAAAVRRARRDDGESQVNVSD